MNSYEFRHGSICFSNVPLLMQLLPEFFLCGCRVLITLKFAQGRPWVEGSLITALQMVPMRNIKIEHTSGIYPYRTGSDALRLPEPSPYQPVPGEWSAIRHLAQPSPGIRMSVLPVTRTQYKGIRPCSGSAIFVMAAFDQGQSSSSESRQRRMATLESRTEEKTPCMSS